MTYTVYYVCPPSSLLKFQRRHASRAVRWGCAVQPPFMSPSTRGWHCYTCIGLHSSERLQQRTAEAPQNPAFAAAKACISRGTCNRCRSYSTACCSRSCCTRVQYDGGESTVAASDGQSGACAPPAALSCRSMTASDDDYMLQGIVLPPLTKTAAPHLRTWCRRKVRYQSAVLNGPVCR